MRPGMIASRTGAVPRPVLGLAVAGAPAGMIASRTGAVPRLPYRPADRATDIIHGLRATGAMKDRNVLTEASGPHRPRAPPAPALRGGEAAVERH